MTNLDNGESVIVRVNDRGPFHDGRVVDLSYAAAVRLGITQRGTGNVEVRALSPGDDNLLVDKPSRRERRAAAAASVASAAPARTPSDMDTLVGRLPSPSPASPSAGRPAATQAAQIDNAPVTVSALPAAPVAVAAAARPASRPAQAAAPAPGSTLQQQVGNVFLQVASFASRDNATRALGQLSSAGIVGASISDIVSGGRTLWRLRVRAADHASASELAGRIVGLGFGSPQIVKD